MHRRPFISWEENEETRGCRERIEEEGEERCGGFACPGGRGRVCRKRKLPSRGASKEMRETACTIKEPDWGAEPDH